MVEPTFAAVPPDWTVKEASSGDVAPNETGWMVARVPAGFVKIMEGFRKLRGRRDPVAHLVFSDGLVAISVFVEPYTTGLRGAVSLARLLYLSAGAHDTSASLD